MARGLRPTQPGSLSVPDLSGLRPPPPQRPVAEGGAGKGPWGLGLLPFLAAGRGHSIAAHRVLPMPACRGRGLPGARWGRRQDGAGSGPGARGLCLSRQPLRDQVVCCSLTKPRAQESLVSRPPSTRAPGDRPQNWGLSPTTASLPQHQHPAHTSQCAALLSCHLTATV